MREYCHINVSIGYCTELFRVFKSWVHGWAGIEVIFALWGLDLFSWGGVLSGGFYKKDRLSQQPKHKNVVVLIYYLFIIINTHVTGTLSTASTAI